MQRVYAFITLSFFAFFCRDAGRQCIVDVQAWLTTLVKEVETQGEATVSTRELFAYMQSEDFIKYCGQKASDDLCAWVLGSFCNNQDRLFFWHRLTLRCFDEYVNSVCEGQNSAAKTTNTGTKANYSVDTAVGALNYRSLLVNKLRVSDMEKQKQSAPLYSNTEAGKVVTRYAELNAHKQCNGFREGKDKYWLWKKDARTMWVMYKKHREVTSPGMHCLRIRQDMLK